MSFWEKCLFSFLAHFLIQFSSVQFIHSVLPDSLWPHESQHTRPLCPSSTPWVHSNSHPSSGVSALASFLPRNTQIWSPLEWTGWIGSFIFLELSCRNCLYIFEISSLSVASFAIIFSHSQWCHFPLLIVSLVVQKLLSLIRSNLFIFAFISNILGGGS